MDIKIDFEKAYDLLRWNFIRHALMELRLPQTNGGNYHEICYVYKFASTLEW